MNHQVTLETLAQRVEALERAVGVRNPTGNDDRWLSVVGMFGGSDFMKQVDEEGRKIREAERVAAQAESAHE